MILAWLAACFVAGVWVAGASGLSLPLLAAPAILIALVCLFPRVRPQAHWMLALAAFLVGVARAPAVHSLHDATYIGYYAGHTRAVAGVVAGEPDVRDTGTEIVVEVRSVGTAATGRAVGGRVSARVPRAVSIEAGDVVTLTGRLITQGRVTSNRADARMLYPKVRVTGHEGGVMADFIAALRHWLAAGIDSKLPEPEASLLIAIALGSRASQLGTLAPALVATGLIHIIAISGVKVALVAGSIYGLARRTGNRQATLVVGLVALAVYVALTGATASGERSALMWMLVFVAAYLGRPTVALLSLSLAAALMIGWDPGLLWDVGFQMSVLGTLGIVALTGPITSRLSPVPSPWREALATTAAAQVATVPIVAGSFHTQSLIGPLANALVLPLLPLLIVLGFVLGSVATVAWLAGPIALLAQGLLALVVAIARGMAQLPGHVAVGSVATWWTVLYLLLFGMAAAWALRRERWAPRREWLGHGRELTLGTWAASASLAVLLVRSPQPSVRLTPVGSGPAVLVQDRGRVVLIGGSPHPASLLQRLGEMLPVGDRTIDAVLVPDARSSDLAGLSAVLEHYGVGEVLDVGLEYPTSTYGQWRARVRGAHIPVYGLRAGVRMALTDGRIDVLAPDGLRSDPRSSIGIVRVVLSGGSYMLAGRADAAEQREVVFSARSLRSDVLVRDPDVAVDGVFVRAVGAARRVDVGEGTG